MPLLCFFTDRDPKDERLRASLLSCSTIMASPRSFPTSEVLENQLVIGTVLILAIWLKMQLLESTFSNNERKLMRIRLAFMVTAKAG